MLIIILLLLLFIASINFFTSSLLNTMGIFFSRFGLFIPEVISLSSMFVYAYFKAERKSMLEEDDLFDRFSAIKDFTSSEVISSGFFFIKSRSAELKKR